MAGQHNPPTTPSPKSERTGKITDFFQSIQKTDPKKHTKRELEVDDEEDVQPAKRLKQDEDGVNGHVASLSRSPDEVDIDTPEPKNATDGGLGEGFSDIFDIYEDETAQPDITSEVEPLETSVPVQPPVSDNHSKRKRPTSSRLLDDIDGGLADSLVGRFGTVRRDKEVLTGE